MKTIIAAVITLAFASGHLVAQTIEYRVFSIRGHLPPEAEFLRLFENKLITPIASGSAAIDENGQFKDEKIDIITQATDFDSEANIQKTQEVETGFRFAGSVVTKDDMHDVSYHFQNTRLIADVIYPHQNGKGMPQPLF